MPDQALDALRDEGLLARYAGSGDRAALGEIVRRHWPEAFRLAFRLVGERSLAEDVAQQSFVALMRGAGRFEEGRAFGPWFRTIVMNTARNASESRRTRRRHEERVPPRAVPTGEAETHLAARELETRLTVLPYELRSPLVLHFYEGCSLDEVALVLGCPKSTVQSRIGRGLERLREALVGAGFALAPLELETLLAKARARNATFAGAPAPRVETLLADARRLGAVRPALKWGATAFTVAAAAGVVALFWQERLPAPVAEAPRSAQLQGQPPRSRTPKARSALTRPCHRRRLPRPQARPDSRARALGQRWKSRLRLWHRRRWPTSRPRSSICKLELPPACSLRAFGSSSEER
jgi:RNA polymerase sigma-70 factor (ECF subfamily)